MKYYIRTLLLFLGLFLPQTNSIAKEHALIFISPENINIRYTGRWNFDNPKQPWVVWQGSSIITKFKGTKIDIDIDPGSKQQQFRVIIDGKPNKNRLFLKPGRATRTLAENLAPGEHTIEIMNEILNRYKTTFYGIKIKGEILKPHPIPKLRIEWFGDSNMDGTSNYSEKDTGDSGTYYAYPAMVTRILGAEMNLQARGGATLDGDKHNNVRSFIFSEDFLTKNQDYRSNFNPHIIVINAGANDINKADKNTILLRYKKVISDLRKVYGPQPHIVLMNAYGWDINEPANYSKEVLKEVDDNVSVFLFPWLWEKWHGSQWEHSGQAHLLLDHIESINPNWKKTNPPVIVDGFGRNGNFANGSFEHAAPFGAFGWRYMDEGIQRIHDAKNSAYGEFYIRLEQNQQVHQPTDATADFKPGGTKGGEIYTITATMRAATEKAKAQIRTDFQDQQIWKRRAAKSETFELSNEWKNYTTIRTAEEGVWTLFTTLKANKGTIEIDNVRMTFSKP